MVLSPEEIRSRYRERKYSLDCVARELEVTLREMLDGLPRIDTITSRAKSVDSFVGKAVRECSETGIRKYEYPFHDIQDQVGCRVVVYYRSDVERVKERVLAELHPIENNVVEPDDPKVFGYEAQHFIFLVPPHVSARCSSPVRDFELQISTMFQHAWAQAEHDLGYKARGCLTELDQRRIAWAAAQAWGADILFDELWKSSSS